MLSVRRVKTVMFAFEPFPVKNKFSLHILGTTLVLMCVYSMPAFAQGPIVAGWIGTGGGSWSDKSNWNCVTSTGNTFHCVPDSNTNPGSTFTVNIDNNEAVLDISPRVDSVGQWVFTRETHRAASR